MFLRRASQIRCHISARSSHFLFTVSHPGGFSCGDKLNQQRPETTFILDHWSSPYISHFTTHLFFLGFIVSYVLILALIQEWFGVTLGSHMVNSDFVFISEQFF